jgi:hypothetical protein
MIGSTLPETLRDRGIIKSNVEQYSINKMKGAKNEKQKEKMN